MWGGPYQGAVTKPGAQWVPYLGTPPFSTYPSGMYSFHDDKDWYQGKASIVQTILKDSICHITLGHSTFTASSSEVIREFLGSDKYIAEIVCYEAGASENEPKITDTTDSRYKAGFTDVPNSGAGTRGYTPATRTCLEYDCLLSLSHAHTLLSDSYASHVRFLLVIFLSQSIANAANIDSFSLLSALSAQCTIDFVFADFLFFSFLFLLSLFLCANISSYATYTEAANAAGASRLYAGFHIPDDNDHALALGKNIGAQAYRVASALWDPPTSGSSTECGDSSSSSYSVHRSFLVRHLAKFFSLNWCLCASNTC